MIPQHPKQRNVCKEAFDEIRSLIEYINLALGTVAPSIVR